MNISVFGLGYVGSVSSACLAGHGHRIHGVDINPDKVAMINAGKPPVVEPGLAEKLKQVVCDGHLTATTDAAIALSQSEVTFVVVATPSASNGEINPEYLYRTCKEIAAALSQLNRKQLVVIRSSVLPDIYKGCQKIFEEQSSGQVELCASPEFLREGSAIADFEKPPYTILGTNNSEAEALLRDIYAGIEAPVVVLGPLEAIMVKYASNIFHGLKVAFANEVGAVCKAQGIDSHAVMSTFVQDTVLNISRHYLRPGFAFGGSCLPKDIRAVISMSQQYGLDMPLVSSILPSNEGLLERAFDTIVRQRKNRIGLIGLSFKPNSDDLRESPFVKLARRLLDQKTLEIRIFDPNVSLSLSNDVGRANVEKVIPNITSLISDNLNDLLGGIDVLVIGHAYPEVREMVGKIAPSTVILDFSYVPELKSFKGTYLGINW